MYEVSLTYEVGHMYTKQCYPQKMPEHGGNKETHVFYEIS